MSTRRDLRRRGTDVLNDDHGKLKEKCLDERVDQWSFLGCYCN